MSFFFFFFFTVSQPTTNSTLSVELVFLPWFLKEHLSSVVKAELQQGCVIQCSYCCLNIRPLHPIQGIHLLTSQYFPSISDILHLAKFTWILYYLLKVTHTYDKTSSDRSKDLLPWISGPLTPPSLCTFPRIYVCVYVWVCIHPLPDIICMCGKVSIT